MQMGGNPNQWGGPRLTWEDRQNLERLIFVLDDAAEQGHWDRVQAGLQNFSSTLTAALSMLREDVALASQVRRVAFYSCSFLFCDHNTVFCAGAL
jgi:hypothetical protein